MVGILSDPKVIQKTANFSNHTLITHTSVPVSVLCKVYCMIHL